MNSHYKPSGKFSPLSALYLAVASVTAIPLLAYLYIAITHALLSIGFVFYFVNFVVTLGFGVSVAGIMNFVVLGWGKVRNVVVAIVLSTLAGLIAYYWQWVFYLQEMYYTEDTVLTIAQNPIAVRTAVRDLLQTGTMTIENNTINGFWLFIIWLIEATAIIGPVIFIGKAKAGQPFSESARKWAKEIKTPLIEYLEEQEAEAVKKGNYGLLANVREGSERSHHAAVTLYDMHDGQWYVSIENKYVTADDKGKVTFEDQPVLKYALLDASLIKALKNPKPGIYEDVLPSNAPKT